MRNLKVTLLMVLVLGLGASLVGCGSDDNPTTPATDTLTLDSAMAEDFTLQALEVVNNIVVEVPDFANGDFAAWSMAKAELAKANSDSVAWDSAQSAWVFSYAGPLFEVEAPNYWNVSLDLWVQYRNAQGPMQFPLGATEMTVRYGTGMDLHMVEGPEAVDMTYDMNTNMVVSYLGENGYRVVGTGDTVMDVSQVSAEGSQAGRVSMDWELDVTVSDAGCPNGTAVVNTQGWRLAADYDGQGNVAWVLTGPNYQASGSDFVGCGQPAK